MSLQYFVICDWCGKVMREKESDDCDELSFCSVDCHNKFFPDEQVLGF